MAQSNRLSNREWEVVKLLLQGKSNKMIASSLGISNRTVEFHLKNIYTKYEVNTRVELILKLGNTTGRPESGKPGYSTVVLQGESAENRDTPGSRTDRGTSSRDIVSIIGKELEMKNLFNTKHVPAGVIIALLTGFLWVAVFRHFGHMSLTAIQPWVLPLIIILGTIGLSVGLIGKRNAHSRLKVSFSTLAGTGIGAIAMLPLVAIVVYPLGKLAEWLGLINRSAISTDVTSALVIVAMLVLWLMVGIATGAIMLSVTIKKTKQTVTPTGAPEHSL